MKNLNSNEVAVGFSANGELSWEINPKDHGREKIILSSTSWKLAGTSLNVVTALKNFQVEAKLLAFTGKDETNTVILNHLLSKSEIDYQCYPILNKSHFAIMPDDVFQGKISLGEKGNVDITQIADCLVEIEKLDARWRVATGIRVEELELAKSLLNPKNEGFRSLNPSIGLVQDKSSFLTLLKNTDLLIMNMNEFRACEVTSPRRLHDFGPKLIIVTDEEKGGIVSHVNFSEQRFQANANYIIDNAPIYVKGAGDWFHGSFVSMCQKNGQPYVDLSCTDLMEFVNFGAKVSGKKVTMNGSSNGPTIEDL